VSAAVELIDLSQEIYQGMPVYPGHLKTVVWEHASHEETARNFEGGFSFRSNGLLMSDHGPTHVDAIAHLDPRAGAPTIDAMALETFYGEATCLDLAQGAADVHLRRRYGRGRGGGGRPSRARADPARAHRHL
jgi:kynurenine formamidase